MCGQARACTRAKFSQSHKERWLIVSRWPTWPLNQQVLAVGFPRLLLTALSCRLVSSFWLASSVFFCRTALFCSLLLTALFCSQLPCSLKDLPSLVLFRFHGKSRVQALYVEFALKQTKRSSDLHPHPHKRMPPIVSQIFTHCGGGKYLSETNSRINCPRIRFKLFYLSLSIIWCNKILKERMFAFLNRWYYFASAFYVELLCFFSATFYGQFSLFSITRAVRYKVKDSEIRGNCSSIHVLSSLIHCCEGQTLSFYIHLSLRVGTGKQKW